MMKHERAIARAAVHTLAVHCVAWLAFGQNPSWTQRRVRGVMTPDPGDHCRCGHRWYCHRWIWSNRTWWRLFWRRYERRSVAHECNVQGCGCQWFRERGVRHLPLRPAARPGTTGRAADQRARPRTHRDEHPRHRSAWTIITAGVHEIWSVQCAPRPVLATQTPRPGMSSIVATWPPSLGTRRASSSATSRRSNIERPMWITPSVPPVRAAAGQARSATAVSRGTHGRRGRW
jgi:hypothetical protein